MKKITALILVAVMLCAASAFAVELNWSDAEEAAAQMEGRFVEVEAGAKFWIPDFLEPYELTDENKNDGWLAVYLNEDQTQSVSVIWKMYEGTEEDFKALITEQGGVNIMDVTVNGIPAIIYDFTPNNSGCVSIIFSGTLLEFAMAPIDDEAFNEYTRIIVSSIQAV